MTTKLQIHATPKAKKSEILGWAVDVDGRQVLKVRVAAPPEDGKANAELIRLLAHALKLPKSALSLSRGATSRYKTVEISDETAPQKIAQLTVIKA